MKREVTFTVWDSGAPANFKEDAERAIAMLPEDWEAVYVRPSFNMVAADRKHYGEYVGAQWLFLREGKYVSFLTEQPGVLSDDAVRKSYVDEVNHSEVLGRDPDEIKPATERELAFVGPY